MIFIKGVVFYLGVILLYFEFNGFNKFFIVVCFGLDLELFLIVCVVINFIVFIEICWFCILFCCK